IECGFDRGREGQVKVSADYRDDRPKGAERREQGASDLSIRSGDENAHQTCPYLGRCLISARSGAAASRADNFGLSKPHVMPIAGSFHRTTVSSAGLYNSSHL